MATCFAVSHLSPGAGEGAARRQQRPKPSAGVTCGAIMVWQRVPFDLNLGRFDTQDGFLRWWSKSKIIRLQPGLETKEGKINKKIQKK